MDAAKRISMALAVGVLVGLLVHALAVKAHGMPSQLEKSPEAYEKPDFDPPGYHQGAF